MMWKPLLCVLVLLIASQCHAITDGTVWYEWRYREATGENPAIAYFLTDAQKDEGARCLDGTPAAYYFRNATGTGPQQNKWLIHMEGGGWCVSLDDCYQRSLTDLGSSKGYPSSADLGDGYFSQNPSENPMFYNWNVVYIKYCDGGSFSGNNETVSQWQGHDLYFRGIRILDATLKDLLINRGMENATDVVVSGCSAGGLASFLHVDHYREVLPPSINVVGMPDSGFFLDYESDAHYHSYLIWVFQQMNSTSGVNQACINYYTATTGETWKCIFAQHTAPFIVTPTFPLQAMYDSWQVPNILGSDNPALINSFGQNLTQLVISQLLDTNPAHGVFLDACYHHCGYWGGIAIDGDVQAIAFQKWFEGGSKKAWIQNGTYPCDSCCSA